MIRMILTVPGCTEGLGCRRWGAMIARWSSHSCSCALCSPHACHHFLFTLSVFLDATNTQPHCNNRSWADQWRYHFDSDDVDRGNGQIKSNFKTYTTCRYALLFLYWSVYMYMHGWDKNDLKQKYTYVDISRKIGVSGESNSRSLTPEARIMPLDHWP